MGPLGADLRVAPFYTSSCPHFPPSRAPPPSCSKVDTHRRPRRLAASTQACVWLRLSALLALCFASSASLCFLCGRSRLCHLRRRTQIRDLRHRQHHGPLGHRHLPRLCPKWKYPALLPLARALAQCRASVSTSALRRLRAVLCIRRAAWSSARVARGGSPTSRPCMVAARLCLFSCGA